ncbi:hypothetical protein BN1221_04338c [Brenneria goodwinii]|uniref:Uncharacterized protein n=1 Tax=Brenneria goodwinii TaxID=1109412 RepID=A0A0G4K0X4_9GAMM|nr:hypothetical protein BN1221_04338c [Brenneria goodwinii]
MRCLTSIPLQFVKEAKVELDRIKPQHISSMNATMAPAAKLIDESSLTPG